MNNFTSGLIPCSTCSHTIGTQAETCPQCGSPNHWKHPQLLTLEESKSTPTRRKITYKIKGAEISASNSYHSLVFILVYWVFAIPFMFAAGGEFGFFGAVIAGAVLGLIWTKGTKQRSFSANLNTGVWQSSDDSFWWPLVEELGIESSKSKIKSEAA